MMLMPAGIDSHQYMLRLQLQLLVFYIYGQFWSVSPNGHKQMAYIIYLMEVWRTRTRFLNVWIYKM